MSARGRCGEGEDILMHRQLHHDRDGVWTWRVRGAKVPAVQKNDVCLEIDPAAAAHYCPDCWIGPVRQREAGADRHHRVVRCQDCGSAFVLVFVHDRPAVQTTMN